jgi:Trypsin
VLRRYVLLGLLCGLFLPTAAHAVVGGERISPSSAPWFVQAGICGGTLIAPDRVATAAHCTDPIDMGDFERIKVGREVRRGIRVALPATWPERRTGFAADDVAIIQLDRPVTSVRPVPLLEPGAKLPSRLRIVGQGKTRWNGPTGATPLTQAMMKSVRDADCKRRWLRSDSKYRKHFRGPIEVCAIDANGRAPLDSVCAGDSGGPILAGTLKRPVLVGIISWTGERCGADKLPTVGAEAAHFREFLTAAEPVWAPVPAGPTRAVRTGGTLTCELPAWTVAPERVEVRWRRRVRDKDSYEFKTVGSGASYTPTAADRGQLLTCEALGSNGGGRTETPFGPDSSIRG